MSHNKCKNCGSTDIDVDPARGDAVCTSCGSVLEHSIIVAEVQFEENAHGVASALGQFVSSDSNGGATGFGNAFLTGIGKESREITIQNAKRGITNLAQQLRLNQHCIDTALNFYKMALNRQLTKGRKNTHVLAACVYMTCRIEGTPHMIIDFSDVLQICVYELGRTYLRLSQALCINMPSMDPCLYILRFANRLDFGEKTHEVSMTALRLVQRMKRDSIHTGRRPSGLCGAALLMAGRLHEFNRTVSDIIKIVKVHESTLKKRLLEFGETPSSALTLDEFMTIDLEEEQDPPSFKAARKKDKERLKVLDDEVVRNDFSQLRKEIDRLLEDKSARKRNRHVEIDVSEFEKESEDAENFIVQSTIGTINGCLNEDSSGDGNSQPKPTVAPTGLGPSIACMGLSTSTTSESENKGNQKENSETGEIDLDGIDDSEIDSYIMSEAEMQSKDTLWMKINADYLREQKEKAEKLAKEKEEGKPEKKKRRLNTKKNTGPANSAGEAIEKMLQEKKISSKINYDVLKSLNVNNPSEKPEPLTAEPKNNKIPTKESVEKSAEKGPENSVKEDKMSSVGKKVNSSTRPRITPRKPKETVSEPNFLVSLEEEEQQPDKSPQKQNTESQPLVEFDDADEFDDEPENEPDEPSIAQMLNHHRNDDDYYGEFDYDEY